MLTVCELSEKKRYNEYMCGRYALDGNPVVIKKRFNLNRDPISFQPHFNVSPGMMMPIIKIEQEPIAVLAKWGLIPAWARDPKIGYKMINARAESLLEKPSFKKPFVSQRCLIPATGFYEWGLVGKDKVPYLIKLKSEELFAFAGLYDIWKDVEGKQLLTFTIITTLPNKTLEAIHNRMPVILPKTKEQEWLDPSNRDINKLSSMLTPYPDDDMEASIVSKLVNNPENDKVNITDSLPF